MILGWLQHQQQLGIIELQGQAAQSLILHVPWFDNYASCPLPGDTFSWQW